MQVQSVKFKTVSSSYCLAVLSSIGHQLLQVQFEECKEIDLSQLASCGRLEELEIDWKCSVMSLLSSTPIHSIQSLGDTFLPRLKKLECLVCLGPASPFFESHRPALKDLTLSCSHIGISKATHLDWNHVPDLWPNLKCINFSYAKNLRLNMIRLFVSKMPNLIDVSVPDIIDWDDDELAKLAKDFIEEFKLSKNISFIYEKDLFKGCSCCYQPNHSG